MHLTQIDISRIQQQYTYPFYIASSDGWLHLKNKNGRCIFHNGNHCTIYKIRPQGCRLYPHVYDIDKKQMIYDKLCPYPDFFPQTKQIIKQLHVLITQLFKEQNDRIKLRKSQK